jgi:hypothetical protein
MSGAGHWVFRVWELDTGCGSWINRVWELDHPLDPDRALLGFEVLHQALRLAHELEESRCMPKEGTKGSRA